MTCQPSTCTTPSLNSVPQFGIGRRSSEPRVLAHEHSPVHSSSSHTSSRCAFGGRLGVLFRVRNVPRGLEQGERPNVFGFNQWLQKVEVNGVDPSAVEPRYLGSRVDRVLVDNSLSCECKQFCRIGRSASGL